MATENKCPHCGKPVPSTALQGICPECMFKAGLAAETGEVGPDGTVVAKPPSQLAPRVEDIAPHFPQLEILECLGRGGMGVVYKARQPKLDRFVALKILSRNRANGTPDAEFAERFQREARALARLNHPDIVAVYDFGEAGGYHYLLMEYVDGLTLRQLFQTRKLSPEEALTIVPKICEALQFAHERGIVHRDIKPENILLDKQGQVKIADFGIAKILSPQAQDRSLTGAKDVIGTPHYMAPEQVEKPATVDHRADIYSLGVVFYEMLTGELPLGKFQPPSQKVQVDVRLDEVVLHALEKEPERRYQHASEVKKDVETIATTYPAQGSSRREGAPFVKSEIRNPKSEAAERQRRLRIKASCFFIAAACFVTAAVLEANKNQVVPAFLCVIAVIGFGVAGYRHGRAVRAHTTVAPAGGSEREEAQAGKPGALLRGIVKSIAKRLMLVAVAAAVLGDAFSRVSIHWRESAQELWLLPFVALSVAAVLWAAWPVFRQQRPRAVSALLWLATSVLLFFGLWVFSIFYSSYLAPNLGLYSEPDWMVENAGWQRQQRLGSAKFLWKRKLIAPQFGQTGEVTLSLDNEQQVGFADLDTGRRAFRSGLGASEILEWARAEKLDAVAWIKAGRLSVEGLDLAGLPVSDYHWEKDSPQNVADYFLLEWQKPKESTTLWPLADHWGIERHEARTSMPGWLITNNVSTFYFRTREGRMGLLQVTGVAGNPFAVSVRCKLVRSAGAGEMEPALTLAPATRVPPVVVQTVPESGAAEVDPALAEIRVTFSKPMRDGDWAWCKWGEENFPELTGESKYLDDQRTCVLPVRLQPGKVYALWLNSEYHQNFKDREGQSAVPYLLIFQTRK